MTRVAFELNRQKFDAIVVKTKSRISRCALHRHTHNNPRYHTVNGGNGGDLLATIRTDQIISPFQDLDTSGQLDF